MRKHALYPECVQENIGEQDTSNCNQLSVFDEILPSAHTLYNAYPNRFNPVITISYNLPKDGSVQITIHDLLGNVVTNLINKEQSTGLRSVQWNATNIQGRAMSAGVYLYTINAGKFRQTKKMILLK